MKKNKYICLQLKKKAMLITTTNNLEGKVITQYFGIVSGETIIGANIFRDFFASIRDIVGGRSSSYEEVLRKAKESAIAEKVYDHPLINVIPFACNACQETSVVVTDNCRGCLAHPCTLRIW